MLKTLNNIKECINNNENNNDKKINNINNKIKYYINENKYEDGIKFLKNKLKNISDSNNINFERFLKSEIVKIYNAYIVYLINNNQTKDIKSLFKEAEMYIDDNIYSYLLNQNNYSCYLSQNNHIKQAKSIILKNFDIDILNYLTLDNEIEENSLNNIEKDYTNLSSLDNLSDNKNDSLLYSLQSLCLKQYDKIFNNKKNNIFLNYYNLGIQQENLNYKNDKKKSFYLCKTYFNEECKNKKDFNFIKKLKCNKSDENLINFDDGLNNNKEINNIKKKYSL